MRCTMPSATITSKGQITIPKGIRARLGLETGDRIAFAVDDTGAVRFVPVTKDVTALKGIVPKPDKTVSVGDMKATVAARAGRR